MAIIQCPACGKKISNKAAACPHCGVDKQSNGQPARRPRGKKKANLMTQQLIAVSIFIAGALWMISIHLAATPRPYPIAALVFTATGGIWYLLTRARMLWNSRNT